MVVSDNVATRRSRTPRRRSAVVRRREVLLPARRPIAGPRLSPEGSGARLEAGGAPAPARPPRGAGATARRSRRPRRASSASTPPRPCHGPPAARTLTALRLATSRAVDNVRPEGGEEGRVEQPDKGLLGGAGGARRRHRAPSAAQPRRPLRATANARTPVLTRRAPTAGGGRQHDVDGGECEIDDCLYAESGRPDVRSRRRRARSSRRAEARGRRAQETLRVGPQLGAAAAAGGGARRLLRDRVTVGVSVIHSKCQNFTPSCTRPGRRSYMPCLRRARAR